MNGGEEEGIVLNSLRRRSPPPSKSVCLWVGCGVGVAWVWVIEHQADFQDFPPKLTVLVPVQKRQHFLPGWWDSPPVLWPQPRGGQRRFGSQEVFVSYLQARDQPSLVLTVRCVGGGWGRASREGLRPVRSGPGGHNNT